VFKVTDRPEIHSNGFHLRFDKTSGPMGYILPHWVEDERPLDLPQIPGTTQNRSVVVEMFFFFFFAAAILFYVYNSFELYLTML